MLGKTLSLSFLGIFVTVCWVNNAVGAVVVLPEENDQYSWDKVKCLAQNADLVIQSRGAEAKDPKSPARIQFIVKNFRSLWANAKDEKLTLTVDDKSVGSVLFTNRLNQMWGDLKLKDLKTVCHLTVTKSPDQVKEIVVKGNCRSLGDVVLNQGPRVHFMIDDVEPLACANPFL